MFYNQGQLNILLMLLIFTSILPFYHSRLISSMQGFVVVHHLNHKDENWIHLQNETDVLIQGCGILIVISMISIILLSTFSLMFYNQGQLNILFTR